MIVAIAKVEVKGRAEERSIIAEIMRKTAS